MFDEILVRDNSLDENIQNKFNPKQLKHVLKKKKLYKIAMSKKISLPVNRSIALFKPKSSVT